MESPATVKASTLERGDTLHPEPGYSLDPEDRPGALDPGQIVMIVLTAIDRHVLVTLLGGRRFLYRPGHDVSATRKD